jgi:hypothetical protein
MLEGSIAARVLIPKSTHLLSLSNERNDEVEVLDQGMTNYQSTKDV